MKPQLDQVILIDLTLFMNRITKLKMSTKTNYLITLK